MPDFRSDSSHDCSSTLHNRSEYLLPAGPRALAARSLSARMGIRPGFRVPVRLTTHNKQMHRANGAQSCNQYPCSRSSYSATCQFAASHPLPRGSLHAGATRRTSIGNSAVLELKVPRTALEAFGFLPCQGHLDLISEYSTSSIKLTRRPEVRRACRKLPARPGGRVRFLSRSSLAARKSLSGGVRSENPEAGEGQ